MKRLIMFIFSIGLSLTLFGQKKTYDDGKFAFDYPNLFIVQTDGDYLTEKTIVLTQEGTSERINIKISAGGAYPREVDQAILDNMEKFRANNYVLPSGTFVTDEQQYAMVKYFDYIYPDGQRKYHRVAIVVNLNYDIVILLTGADRKNVCQLYREVVETFRPGDYNPAYMYIERYNLDELILHAE